MLTRALMVVPLTGCLIGVGPSISVRATGPYSGVAIGFESDLLFEPFKNGNADMPIAEPHPWLLGGGTSFSLPLTNASDVRFVSLYAKGMGSFSALHDTRAAAISTGSIGTTFTRSPNHPIDPTLMVGASGGVLQGVHCGGRSFSVELGVRWVNRGIEVFLAPRVNSLFHVGTPDGECPFRLFGGGVR